MDALDLCISCGSHVADGSNYCSARCMSLDASAASSSKQRRAYALQLPHSHSRGTLASSSVCSDQDPFAAYVEPPQVYHHNCAKRASIESWARGVWGDSGDDSKKKQPQAVKPARSTTPISMVSSSKSSSPSSPSRASRFPLTAAHVAPPALGSTFTSSWSASSSSASSSAASSPIHTPSSSHHARKSSAGSSAALDPWIASPPYEFAYNFPVKQQQQQPARGRPLIRV